MMDELQAERAHSQQLAAAVQELQALVDTVTRDADAAAAEAAAEVAKVRRGRMIRCCCHNLLYNLFSK